MKIVYKIIDLYTHQVLIKKDFNTDDDSYNIIMEYQHEGVIVSQSLGYYNEEKRDEIFNKISSKNCQDFIDNTIKNFS